MKMTGPAEGKQSNGGHVVYAHFQKVLNKKRTIITRNFSSRLYLFMYSVLHIHMHNRQLRNNSDFQNWLSYYDFEACTVGEVNFDFFL